MAKVAVPGTPCGVAGSPGAVWVTEASNARLVKIDPATNAVVARYSPTAGSGSVAADGDNVWVSAHDHDVVYRLPLK